MIPKTLILKKKSLNLKKNTIKSKLSFILNINTYKIRREAVHQHVNQQF